MGRTRLSLGTAVGVVLATLGLVQASSGDRNPTFQHCLKGCTLTYCTSQSSIPLYLRSFGWTCEDDCRYHCGHSFTDNILGGQWHQFYGKWPFYRLGPIQEPFSVLMSFGNLYVNIKGILELRRRVRSENLLRRWLELAGWAQINTWIWSIIFHTRDKPFTERLDYFSATLTVATSLLYAVLRTFHLQTPQSTSRLAYPVTFALAILILSHFAYLLSFPSGSFPYGYHTKFVVFLALIHSGLWVLWTLSFHFQIPTLHVGTRSFTYPLPYPATDRGKLSTRNAYTPTVLVVLTTLAMSFELLDFPPIARVVDAHSVWHACTVPLAMAWWSFFCSDAIEFEGALLGIRGGGVGQSMDEKMPLTGSHSSPNMPSLSGQFTTTSLPSRPRSPSKEMKD